METAILWHSGALVDDLEISQVHELAHAAEHTDGVAPLSEQPRLNLGVANEDIIHLLTWHAGELAGYAQLDTRGDLAVAELVVHPSRRGRGLGRYLLTSAIARVSDVAVMRRTPRLPGAAAMSLRIWAHGNLPAAQALAARAELVAVRELRQLARLLGPKSEHPFPAPPTGLRLRTFIPGADDRAWVALNARAFAHHPEQGRLTETDLHARIAEDWFDPEGFWLLERDGRLIGSVWTKVPTGQPPRSRDGEIYAVGVDPAEQGAGFGALLTQVGLAYLARVGARRAVLYVDGDNAPALATYTQAGFEPNRIDVQYASRPPQVTPTDHPRG